MSDEDKLTKLLEDLYERTYDSAERIGRLVGAVMVKQAGMPLEDAEALIEDLQDTVERAMAQGLKGGLEEIKPQLTRVEEPFIPIIPEPLPKEEALIGRKTGSRKMVSRNRRSKLVYPHNFEKYLRLGWYFKQPEKKSYQIQEWLDKYPPPEWFKRQYGEDENDYVEAVEDGQKPAEDTPEPKELDKEEGD